MRARHRGIARMAWRGTRTSSTPVVRVVAGLSRCLRKLGRPSHESALRPSGRLLVCFRLACKWGHAGLGLADSERQQTEHRTKQSDCRNSRGTSPAHLPSQGLFLIPPCDTQPGAQICEPSGHAGPDGRPCPRIGRRTRPSLGRAASKAAARDSTPHLCATIRRGATEMIIVDRPPPQR